MLVDVEFVKMARARLALIDATPIGDIKWVSNGEYVEIPTREQNRAEMCKMTNSEMAEKLRFEEPKSNE